VTRYLFSFRIRSEFVHYIGFCCSDTCSSCTMLREQESVGFLLLHAVFFVCSWLRPDKIFKTYQHKYCLLLFVLENTQLFGELAEFCNYFTNYFQIQHFLTFLKITR
jgi:hypothetical protein